MKKQIKEIQTDDNKSLDFFAFKKEPTSYPAVFCRELKPFIFECPGRIVVCTVGDQLVGMVNNVK
jgi:hypothetical protein